MTSTARADVRPDPPHSPDGHSLDEFGYRQELHRSLGRYASFAAGFSFISVLTTVFQFFAFGYAFGGPVFFWAWPTVLVGQLLVAACFAELAARYPISGAIYQWSSRLSNPAFGWFAGWIMVIGQIVVVAAAALALQMVMPAIWSGFQLVGGDPTPTSSTGAANAAVLGVILLVLTTLVNVLDNRVLSLVNRVGVTAEIIGAVLIIVLLFTHSERSPGITFHTATAACRMLFSMARDGQLPFAARLADVSPRTGMPNAPAVVVGLLSAALLLLDSASPEAFLAIGTTCIVMLYVAYAMVTGPLLVRRLKGTFTTDGTDETGKPLFSLGRWGIPVNILALLYGLAMTVNLAWPRAEVYDPAGGH